MKEEERSATITWPDPEAVKAEWNVIYDETTGEMRRIWLSDPDEVTK